MKANEFKNTMSKLIEMCTNTLIFDRWVPRKYGILGYFNGSTHEEEVDIAKCVLINFYETWFKQPQDTDLMASEFEKQCEGTNITEQSFIDAVILQSTDMWDSSQWTEFDYPPLIFTEPNLVNPIYIDIQKMIIRGDK